MCIYVIGVYGKYMHIYNLPISSTSIGRVAAMLRIFGSVSNLPLLIIGDYYYHSYDKMVRGKIETGQGYGMGFGGCKRLCPAANGA